MIDKARYFEVAVLGGGASGITAAISSKRAGKSVVICDKMPRLGKKILASGNGRCNLLNEDLSDKYYNLSARPLVKSVFEHFGKSDILNFFQGLGLYTYSDDGRIFPATNQSSSVLKVLEMELGSLAIPVEVNSEITNITVSNDGFLITLKPNNKILCKSLIMATGGKSYPAFGSDGTSYVFAEKFDHKIVDPVPSAVPLLTKDHLCHVLQGQKISAHAKAIVDGKAVSEASGELLFTKYGLSGTAILDISREISIAINRLHKKDAVAVVDMAPFIDERSLTAELEDRLQRNFSSEDLLAGILPNKFGLAMESLLKTKNAAIIVKNIKYKEFSISGTRGWNEADFTAGGIITDEVKTGTLESKTTKRLYFAGEILDVDGCRGGYNLAWAWASGFVAGRNA